MPSRYPARLRRQVTGLARSGTRVKQLVETATGLVIALIGRDAVDGSNDAALHVRRVAEPAAQWLELPD